MVYLYIQQIPVEPGTHKFAQPWPREIFAAAKQLDCKYGKGVLASVTCLVFNRIIPILNSIAGKTMFV